MEKLTHKTLPCGIELVCAELPGRHAVTIELRMLSGTADEPAERLGLGRLVQETIDLGTEKHDGRALSDCFDEIGASHGAWIGRESTGYNSLVLPEYLDRAIELHAEFMRVPTFPQDKVEVAVDLAKQEWDALQDDGHGLADKLIGQQAYGNLLGRHSIGEPATLERVTRDDLVSHWQAFYHAGRLQVTAAGALDTPALEASLQKHFDGFGSAERAGRSSYEIDFSAKCVHHNKELEQQQIAIAFPGVSKTDSDYPVQRAMLAVLSGGMSSRLFTEVREKQGLVYWVSAWAETPRSGGMIFLGASSTPDRCDTTYKTLLREVDRLGEDLTDDELRRAVMGLVAKVETQGDITRARCNELAEDVFQHGEPLATAEKIRRLKAVTVSDIKSYLDTHPRDRLSVVTLGPRVLDGAEIAPGGSTDV
jgi:predicted Zn-dependent peptidase